MLYLLAPYLTQFWGPFRLLKSYSFLMILGAGAALLLSWYALPRLWHVLPRDRGRAHTPRPDAAQGKPTGAGVLIVLFLLPLWLLVVPLAPQSVGIIVCLTAAMAAGYGDDRAQTPWGELRKGLLDLVVALAASWILCQGLPQEMWLPLHKGTVTVPPWAYIPLASGLLWMTINATNCSDGVDGLAGSLTLLSVFYLGAFLYLVVGHTAVAEYLLVPHYPEGARWSVLLMTAAGGLAGYLWHNAEPSSVLMGDAGSRFLGLLVGVAVLEAGNPFLILVAAPVVLLNGGTGLVKVALLRILRRLGFDIRPGNGNGLASTPGAPVTAPGVPEPRRSFIVDLLHRIRFPLHDHCRKNLKWSNAQVLVRFVLLQAFLTPLLLGFLVKVR